MDAKTFRLGNVINVFGVCEITAIEKNRLRIERKDTAEYCPITSLSLLGELLTREWFTKMNANHGGNIWLSIPNIKSELHFELYQNEIVTILINDFGKTILDPIKYVHELQNLFFVLAKRELYFKIY